MSIMPKIFETDKLYQFETVHLSKRCLDFLNLYPSFPEDISCFNGFMGILEEMEYETPFRASHPSREEPFPFSEKDKFKYRRPVWQAIFETVNSLRGEQFPDQQSCAIFLKEQLHLLHRYIKFVDWMQRSRKEMMGLNLTISFAGQTADVSVDPNLENIGFNAKQFSDRFFKKVLEKLSENKE